MKSNGMEKSKRRKSPKWHAIDGGVTAPEGYLAAGVSAGIKEKGLDFCFECQEFPCKEADFEPMLKAKWLHANERMKEIGVEAFFEENKDKSHYA